MHVCDIFGRWLRPDSGSPGVDGLGLRKKRKTQRQKFNEWEWRKANIGVKNY